MRLVIEVSFPQILLKSQEGEVRSRTAQCPRILWPPIQAPATFGEAFLQHVAEHCRKEDKHSSVLVVSAASPHSSFALGQFAVTVVLASRNSWCRIPWECGQQHSITFSWWRSDFVCFGAVLLGRAMGHPGMVDVGDPGIISRKF